MSNRTMEHNQGLRYARVSVSDKRTSLPRHGGAKSFIGLALEVAL
jgi:hypothetical protein